MATRDWSVVDTVAHIVTLSTTYTSIVRALRYPLDTLVRDTTVDNVAGMNEALLQEYQNRDMGALTAHLRSDIEDLVQTTAQMDPTKALHWLGQARLSVAGLLAHMLNELAVHGRDIALATKRPWYTAPEDAALFFDLFLIGIVHTGYGKLLESDRPVRKGRIAVHFRSPYTAPVAMVLTDGIVTVEKPRPDNDVRLSFDPPGLNLMLFGRISKLRAALTGKVSVGGRRPWLLKPFLTTVHLPS